MQVSLFIYIKGFSGLTANASRWASNTKENVVNFGLSFDMTKRNGLLNSVNNVTNKVAVAGARAWSNLNRFLRTGDIGVYSNSAHVEFTNSISETCQIESNKLNAPIQNSNSYQSFHFSNQ